MKIIGLTGSIAMGKTTAANMLRNMKGVSVFCSDDAVRALYTDPAALARLHDRFPDAFTARQIDKKKMIALLGRDHDRWDALENILHPFVIKAQQKFLRDQKTLGTGLAVLDIPLLFETGTEDRVDFTACVTAPAFLQAQRIAARIAADTITAVDAAFRMERQMPDAEKRVRADFVVQTGAGLAATRAALEDIVRRIRAMERTERRKHA